MVQRLGRAVRNKSLLGRGIVIAETRWFDEEIAKLKAQASKNATAAATTDQNKSNKRVRFPCYNLYTKSLQDVESRQLRGQNN